MSMPNEHVIALDANHIEMAKFISKADPAYHVVLQEILNISLSKANTSMQIGKPTV